MLPHKPYPLSELERRELLAWLNHEGRQHAVAIVEGGIHVLEAELLERLYKAEFGAVKPSIEDAAITYAAIARHRHFLETLTMLSTGSIPLERTVLTEVPKPTT